MTLICIRVTLEIETENILFGETSKIISEHKKPEFVKYADYNLNSEEIISFLPKEIKLNSLIEHDDIITSIAFSPDGCSLVSGSYDESVKIWNLNKTGKNIQTLMNPSKVDDFSISPDGKEIAIINEEGVIIWEIDDLKTDKYEIRRNLTGLDWIGTCKYSPDGQKFTTGSKRHVRFWNRTLKDNWEYKLLKTPDQEIWVSDIAFSPDCRYMVSAHTAEPYLILWNGTTGEFIRSDFEHTLPVYSVAFSPDGNLFASCGADLSIKFWQPENGQLIKSIDNAHNYSIRSLAFSPSSPIIVSGSWDTTVKLWSLNDYQPFATIANHTGKISSIAFSPSGNLLATASHNGKVKLWNMVKDQGIDVLSSSLSNTKSVVYSSSGMKLAVGSFNSLLIYSNVSNEYNLELSISHPDIFNTVKFTTDETHILSGSHNGNISSWNTTDGSQIWTVLGHSGEVKGITMSTDGTKVVSCASDGKVRIWNTTDGGLIQDLIEIERSIYCIKSSSDGKMLAIGSLGDSIRLFNASTGDRIPVFFDYKTRVNSLDFSPDGSILVTGGADGYVNLWNTTSGDRIIQFLENHNKPVQSVSFSNDGKRVISGGLDSKICLWDVIKQKKLLELTDSDNEVNTVSFSPNDNFIASGSTSRAIVWPLDPLPLDVDSDSMLDTWELNHNLNQMDFWDQFQDNDYDLLINSMEYFLGTDPFNADFDNDSILDGWEYLMEIDIFTDNSNSDNDGDSIPDLYEYQHGLNARLNDAGDDKDGDLMPNLWEYNYQLLASVSDDAHDDPDDDWIINVNEFQGKSNPRNFWSVPLFSFSFLHFLACIFLILTWVVIGVTYYIYTQKALIKSLGAPNYITARKIKRSNYPNYTIYVQAETEAVELIESAHRCYLQGETTKAIQQYYQTLIISERLQKSTWAAEIVFQICRIMKIKGELTPSSEILYHIPGQIKGDPLILTYQHMVKALVFEAQKDWSRAKDRWITAKRVIESSEVLSENKFLVTCKGAEIEVEIQQWLNNPSGTIPEELNNRIDIWMLECEELCYYENLCSLLLLRARMALAAYQFDEALSWLDKGKEIASEINYKLFHDLINEERKRVQRHKQRIAALIEAKQFISPQERNQLMEEYLKMAKEFSKDFGK